MHWRRSITPRRETSTEMVGQHLRDVQAVREHMGLAALSSCNRVPHDPFVETLTLARRARDGKPSHLHGWDTGHSASSTQGIATRRYQHDPTFTDTAPAMAFRSAPVSPWRRSDHRERRFGAVRVRSVGRRSAHARRGTCCTLHCDLAVALRAGDV